MTTVPFRIYPPYMTGVPGLIAIEVPQPMRGPNLICGRFTFCIWETDEELAELEDRTGRLGSFQDLAALLGVWNHRPTGYAAGSITLSLIDSVEPGWPFFAVIRWPPAHTSLSTDPEDFCRGAYTIEGFGDLPAALDHASDVLRQLGRQGAKVGFLSPEGLTSGTGRA